LQALGANKLKLETNALKARNQQTISCSGKLLTLSCVT